ncbi:MAG: hypothetical protein SFU56_14810 [Capsulimonadales bacterium]|nr:hypothetical protein [Capsulimonadales bacterium]
MQPRDPLAGRIRLYRFALILGIAVSLLLRRSATNVVCGFASWKRNFNTPPPVSAWPNGFAGNWIGKRAKWTPKRGCACR